MADSENIIRCVFGQEEGDFVIMLQTMIEAHGELGPVIAKGFSCSLERIEFRTLDVHLDEVHLGDVIVANELINRSRMDAALFE